MVPPNVWLSPISSSIDYQARAHLTIMTRSGGSCHHGGIRGLLCTRLGLTTPALTPTPTAPERPTRPGDFATIAEALDFAALQPTGVNIHSLRGELDEVLPYAELRREARALAARLLAAGLSPGERVALAAESDGDSSAPSSPATTPGWSPRPCRFPLPSAARRSTSPTSAAC